MEELDSNDVRLGNMEVAGHTFDKDREFYITNLKKGIVKGNRYRISMDYTASLSDNLKGFYRSQYKDKVTGETR